MMRPPFSWIYHQEPLPWFDDQIDGSVIPLHSHGHNRSALDDTSYPSTSTLSVHVSLGPLFLLRSFQLISLESLSEASQRFQKLSFNSCQLLLPSSPLAPSSHKARYNLSWCGKPNGRTKVGEDERDNDGKW